MQGCVGGKFFSPPPPPPLSTRPLFNAECARSSVALERERMRIREKGGRKRKLGSCTTTVYIVVVHYRHGSIAISFSFLGSGLVFLWRDPFSFRGRFRQLNYTSLYRHHPAPSPLFLFPPFARKRPPTFTADLSLHLRPFLLANLVELYYFSLEEIFAIFSLGRPLTCSANCTYSLISKSSIPKAKKFKATGLVCGEGKRR